MLESVTDIAQFQSDEREAGEFFEKLRWPNGVVLCPFCNGDESRAYVCARANATRKQWMCASCRKRFSVTSRSALESSRVPLGKWLCAIIQMCNSSTGVKSGQLGRALGVNYRSARGLLRRVREASKNEPLATMLATRRAAIDANESSASNIPADKRSKARRAAYSTTANVRDSERGRDCPVSLSPLSAEAAIECLLRSSAFNPARRGPKRNAASSTSSESDSRDIRRE